MKRLGASNWALHFLLMPDEDPCEGVHENWRISDDKLKRYIASAKWAGPVKNRDFTLVLK